MERRVRAARHAEADRAETQRQLNEALARRKSSARFKQLNIVSRQNTPEEFHGFVEDQMKLWGKVVKEANIHLGYRHSELAVARIEPVRIAGPVAQAEKAAARQCRRPARGTRTRMCSGPPTNSPTRRGAATRRPTRRSRTSSRCSIITAARMGWWCRAMRTATTTAWCSTRSRVFRSGCAASPSPTRASRRKRCATGTRSACAACASICSRKSRITCAASGSTCSRCSARPWPSSAGSCRSSATGGCWRIPRPPCARLRARCR